jgi:hypothetical protein
MLVIEASNCLIFFEYFFLPLEVISGEKSRVMLEAAMSRHGRINIRGPLLDGAKCTTNIGRRNANIYSARKERPKRENL